MKDQCQGHIETYGNKNMDDVKGTLGVGLDGENESKKFEEDTKIMGEDLHFRLLWELAYSYLMDNLEMMQ